METGCQMMSISFNFCWHLGSKGPSFSNRISPFKVLEIAGRSQDLMLCHDSADQKIVQVCHEPPDCQLARLSAHANLSGQPTFHLAIDHGIAIATAQRRFSDPILQGIQLISIHFHRRLAGHLPSNPPRWFCLLPVALISPNQFEIVRGIYRNHL